MARYPDPDAALYARACIQDLEHRLKIMTEDRDEYQRLASRTFAPATEFFLVWTPNGPHSPRYKHLSHASARAEAERLAALHPDECFYVLAEAGHAVTASVQWHCKQVCWDEEIPF